MKQKIYAIICKDKELREKLSKVLGVKPYTVYMYAIREKKSERLMLWKSVETIKEHCGIKDNDSLFEKPF